MRMLAVLSCILMTSGAGVRAGEIYDTAGNIVFHTEDTGKTQEVVTINGPVNYRDIALVNHKTGQTYGWSYRWDQVMSDGHVVMDYHFNKRQWRLADGQGLTVGSRVKKESIRRIYTEELGRDLKNNYIDDVSVFKTAEQGDYPLLTYQNGNYINEFGEIVYTLVGRVPDWANIMLLHHYYTETYLLGDSAKIAARREAEADRFGDSNAIALDMLALGLHYETVETRILGGHYRMQYFTEIEGEIINLNTAQIGRLQNKWLILNEKLRRSSRPFVMPQAGHNLSKKKAKKRGVEVVKKGALVFEIKVRPEYLAEFQAALALTGMPENVSADPSAVAVDGGAYNFEAANYWGNELKILENWTDMQACAKACEEDALCAVASYHDINVGAPYTNTCVLRHGVGPRHPEQQNVYSWVKP